MYSTYIVLTLHVRSCTQPQSIEIKDACLLPTEYTDYRWMFSIPQSIKIAGTCILPTEYTDYRSMSSTRRVYRLQITDACILLTESWPSISGVIHNPRVYRLQVYVFYPQSIQITDACLLPSKYTYCTYMYSNHRVYRLQMYVLLRTEYTDYRSMSSTRRVYSCARLLIIEYTDYRSQLHVFYS